MLKAMIVDDEAPARSELKFLLDELGQTEVVAEAASVREAIEKLKEYPCDVMFLDVNMPEATGLQLAEALQHLKFPPAVVFVTAYSEFALDAFKVNAIDYLVKPVETEPSVPGHHPRPRARAAACAGPEVRAHPGREGLARRSSSASTRSVSSWHATTTRTCKPTRTATSSTVSLAQLEKRLDGHGFFRVHRGYLVNLSMVEEIEPVAGGTLLLTLERRGREDPRQPPSRFRVEEGLGAVRRAGWAREYEQVSGRCRKAPAFLPSDTEGARPCGACLQVCAETHG